MTRRVSTTPTGVNKQTVGRTLSALEKDAGFEARVDHASRMFLGRRYAANPLCGGPESDEQFRVSFDEFDCVTYVETILALACSSTSLQFFRQLRDLRYEDGKIGWFTRNHFMTAWVKQNIKRRALADLTRGAETLSKTRTLIGVPGLPPRKAAIRYYPKRRFARAQSLIRSGDVMLFVSTKQHLDVFHMGILIRDGARLLLRHATRSAGEVIEQDVTEFLRANRMPGLIIARPLCQQ